MSDKFKDITYAVSNNLCHSCGVCSSVCSVNALDFKQTISGQLLPYVDYDNCSQCGLCLDVCPGINFKDQLKNRLSLMDPFEGIALKTYVGKAADKYIYENAQSGGIVSAILIDLLEKGEIGGAVVVKMKSGNPPIAEAFIANTREEILQSQKSKYCPTTFGNIINNIDRLNYPVAIVGLSCHIHGLINVFSLRKTIKDKVKYIFGLVCDGIMSYSAIDYLLYRSKTNKKKDKIIIFKDKQYYSYPGNIRVVVGKKEHVVIDQSVRFKIKEIFTPPRCRICFDKMNVFSDISFGDPWGIKGIDENKGESLIVARTQNGSKLIEQAMNSDIIKLREISHPMAIKGQNIEEKRKSWMGYIKAWKDLEYEVPSYSYLINLDNVSCPNLKIYKQKLLDLIYLENFSSRKELIRFVDRMIFFQNIKTKLFMPLRLLNIIKS